MSSLETSASGQQERFSSKNLFPLYSISGSLVLLLQQKLTQDSIQVVSSDVLFVVAKRFVKENKLVAGEKVIIQCPDESGYMLQYRWNCPETGAVIAFQQTPWNNENPETEGHAKLSNDCIYIFSNMVFKSSAEALQEVRKHITVEKIPRSISTKDESVRVTLKVTYNARRAELLDLNDDALEVSIMESEKNEKAANESILHLMGLSLDADSSSLSLDWDIILSRLVVIVPGKKDKEVYKILQNCLSSRS
mmetsp:Transcript_3870/g.4459  ORF Transcript_3870/g.4459 Transcript_3870/m.4459 type:complete len:250 (+) Transcript_3870:117-866(+)